MKIRSSRALEEALQIRLAACWSRWRWLVEGRSIDHTTISEFRRKNPEALKATFVQIGLVAREIGCLPLQALAFDGTRMRANNRRSGSRTPDELRKMKKELAEKFQELEAKSSATDQSDNEQFGKEAAHTVLEELADIQRQQQDDPPFKQGLSIGEICDRRWCRRWRSVSRGGLPYSDSRA